MANGCLNEWLHPVQREAEETVEGSKKLTLLQRLNIAIDVASALDYLHPDCQIPIIHCDIKRINVLLDNELTAHVGDLGLARSLPESINKPANQTSSLGIRGSVGYAAPEYGMGSNVSTYGDVCSYGILLLEMFTGKRPTDEMFKGNLNLHSSANMALSEPPTEIVVPILLQLEDEFETSARDECLISILKIGIDCSKESPRGQSNICDVVAKLHVINNTLMRNR